MNNNPAKINLAVVDDHNLFRQGLIKLINTSDTDNRFEVIFDVENGSAFQEALKSYPVPDIVLMDIDMPKMDGYQTIEWLKVHYPNVKVLVVSMLDTEESILKMLRLGIHGYLSKDIEVIDMHRALGAIANGSIYYSGFISEIISKINDFKNDEGASSPYSTTELRFLELICSEKTYFEIADELNLSPKTVDNYRVRFFKEFDVKNRASLAVYVIKNGIIDIEGL